MIYPMDTKVMPYVRFIGHIEYKEPWCHFERVINEYILYIVKKGQLHIEEDGIQYTLKKGDFLLLHPNKVHKGFKTSKCFYYFIHFQHKSIYEPIDKDYEYVQTQLLERRKEHFLSNLYEYDDSLNHRTYLPKTFHISNSMALNDIFQLLNQATDDFYKKMEDYRQLISCKFYEVLLRLGQAYLNTHLNLADQQNYSMQLKIDTITSFIHSNYYRKITSQDFENLLENNYNYLNRIFQKHSGYTINNFINVTRVEKSKELLSTTPMAIKEIAYLVGIDDPYYFSKLFKKFTGLTPTQYRNVQT
ncbi:AraC family transcriptional regulator [Vallitalea okinawensis]|uniref:AraC family transcriptional regulator n=1 Tax=Vallitalea okinawensis TaxID=2078660 RepID=UPI000CFD3CA9|nr:AraC family transcriptional regulator [Vallitalea okinawensis]